MTVSQTEVDLFEDTISDPSSFQGFGDQDHPTSHHSEARHEPSPNIDQSGPRRRQFSESRSTSPEPRSKTARRSNSRELVQELAILVKQSESGVASTLEKKFQSIEAINHWLSTLERPPDHAAQHPSTEAFDRQSSALPCTLCRPYLHQLCDLLELLINIPTTLLTLPVPLPEYLPTPRFLQGEIATGEVAISPIPAWNPNKVLSMLEQPEYGNNCATPSRLLMKTLFLIALASGNRVSEIAAFTRVGSSILPGSKKAILDVQPGFLDKNQTMDRSPPNILIKALLNKDRTPHCLCLVDALHCWLAMINPWNIDSVFINPKSCQKMNRRAIFMLLVTTINQSQPGVLARAHDIRKVSANFTWANGVSPHQTIQTMFWKSTKVFINKYLFDGSNPILRPHIRTILSL